MYAEFGDRGGLKKLRPTRTKGTDFMKKVFLLMALILGVVSVAHAQKGKESLKAFEEAYGRTIEPLHNAYGVPILYDVRLGNRETFGPYPYQIKGELKEAELQNYKNRAIYKAMLEKGADELVGTIFDSYVKEDDSKTLWVELSAYPAYWTNFRNLDPNSKEVEMIRVIYPSAQDSEGKILEEKRKAGAAVKN